MVVVNSDHQTLLERFVSWIVKARIHIVWPMVGKTVVHSGIHLEMPDSVWCHILPRSSTLRKKMTILGGIIDSGYRGELLTVIHNFGLIPRMIIHGQRYAQVIFYPAFRPDIQEIDALGTSDRGGLGFGSTGQ